MNKYVLLQGEPCKTDSLSGGTRTLWGHPDRLRWWGYRPVTWPVPSHPGVGHLMSFLSVRGESTTTTQNAHSVLKYSTQKTQCSVQYTNHTQCLSAVHKTNGVFRYGIKNTHSVLHYTKHTVSLEYSVKKHTQGLEVQYKTHRVS